ncbi:nucleoside deaminase [Ornithinimicrobium faecis]|uniref:Nucleoside deaminase n=1 Tax=Ornithinimicrobium faecis TaxID=2934158 RepID=A0ABY4YUA4_9MICO|nr:MULTISPECIES: nucleoside deaminase [unclassified Ornithinimicrobium]USQ79938.1 nucleoside deaminase [Ornithinimicrobium sp. HY1793]
MTQSPTDAPVPASEHADYLLQAVDLARRGVASGEGGPFGALVVRDGEVLGEGWNRVLGTNDPTAHAEVTAIRAACERLGSFQLTGAVVYASCEPCPMCLGAVYWARPTALYYAATRHDAAAAGFSDAMIYDEIGMPPDDRTVPFRQLEVPGGADVFAQWLAKDDRTDY